MKVFMQPSPLPSLRLGSPFHEAGILNPPPRGGEMWKSLALSLRKGQMQRVTCHHFSIVVIIIICWVITAPGRGPQALVPQFTHPRPAQFQGSPRGAGLVGEGRWQLGGRRGRASFLSPTHTGLRWVGADGSGRGRVAVS